MLNKKKAQTGETKNQRFLLAPIFPKTKKGQTGETITWIVATIIIIVLLIFFIYVSSMFGKAKKIGVYSEEVFSTKYSRTQDLILEKSLFVYFSLDDLDKKEAIYNHLKILEKNNKLYIDLDRKIFEMEGFFNG